MDAEGKERTRKRKNQRHHTAVHGGIFPSPGHLKVPRVIFSKWLADSLSSGSLLHTIAAESRTAASTLSSPRLLALVVVAVLRLQSNMVSTRWNLAVGPVVMVAAAFGAVLVATVASELSGPKQRRVLEEKLKA